MATQITLSTAELDSLIYHVVEDAISYTIANLDPTTAPTSTDREFVHNSCQKRAWRRLLGYIPGVTE